jgi:hypothetical protein
MGLFDSYNPHSDPQSSGLLAGWTGNTPEVRQQVARILLQRAPGMNRTALENMVSQTIARLQRAQGIVRNLGRAASGGLGVAVSPSRRADNSRKLQ